MTVAGHALWLPEPGAYVRVWKWLKRAAIERPYAEGWLWGRFGTAAEHLADFDTALTRRVNMRGSLSTGDDRLFWDYKRDQRKLEDYRQRRIVHRGSGFTTEQCRLRFPDVQAVMTDRGDRY